MYGSDRAMVIKQNRTSANIILILLFLFPGIVCSQSATDNGLSLPPSLYSVKLLPIPLYSPRPDYRVGSIRLPQPEIPTDWRLSDPVKYFHLQNTPNMSRVAVIGGVTLAAGLAINHQMRNAWWSGNRGPFHYREAFEYARNIDKLGHAYAGYLSSFVFYRMTNWTGINESRSVWYGASLGLLFQLYIETQDGFSTRWGFERWDAIGDFFGAALFVARYYYKPLQYFQMKFSYLPSDRLGDRRNAAWVENWIDDYEGHTYWISFRAGQFAHDLFDTPSWVRLFNIAGGWSLSPGREHTEFYLGLDWNFEALPGSNWLLRRLWEGLDHIRFPAPAVRIRPDGVWYGIYI
jgi:hypothetical protein